MGLLRSSQDWSGREVEGVVLGAPSRENQGDEETPPSGDYIWGHPSLITGVIDENGDVWVNDEEVIGE